MRTEFEELDVVPVEQEITGYYGKFAIGMISIIVITLIIGFIRWELL